MTKNSELITRQREIAALMANASDEEAAKLQKEYDANKRSIEINNQEAIAQANVKREDPQNEALRTFLREAKPGSKFEFKRDAVSGTAMADTTAVTPNYLQSVLDKPEAASVYRLAGCPVAYGATGLNDWAYAGSASVNVQDELTSYGDAEKLDLTKKTATQQRLKAKIIISSQAINNASTDLVALANRKINDAYEQAINFAAVSTAKFGANFYGGFAHSDKQSYSYTSTGFTFADAMAMVALVANKDFDVTKGCFVMGPSDFYALKATPKDAGSGLMVIDDNNRLGGFPVFVSTAINRTTVKGTVSGANIGFGLFNFLPCLQHGAVRLSIDAESAAAADIDGAIITCNADWSMTDLFPEAFVLGTKKA